ncbi:MAG: DUF4143 domain-containing protein [Acidimicrobiia bacterium]
MDEYSRRALDDELDALLPDLAAVAIDGAKGVGKTQTAVQRAGTIRALDVPGELEVARANPQHLLIGTPPVLIDEWQRFPESWDLVRRAVDAGAEAGRFILTGSATPRTPGTHSGAGRIVHLRMRPLSFAERQRESATVSLAALLSGSRPAIDGETSLTLEDYVEEICCSGLPGIRGLGRRARRAQLDGYIERIIDRDFAEAGRTIRNPAALRRWMGAYAAATATDASYEKLLDAATPGEGDKPAKGTTAAYRDVLERLWLVDPLAGWSPTHNQLKRLVASPKHHLADPALATRLLGLDEGGLLDIFNATEPAVRDGTYLGHLFESLVTLSLRVYAQHAEASVYHLRTKAGRHEIDHIVERDDRRVVAVEVKLTHTVLDAHVEHLRWLRGQIGDDLLDAVVVSTGRWAYRRADGIAVVPLALLGP